MPTLARPSVLVLALAVAAACGGKDDSTPPPVATDTADTEDTEDTDTTIPYIPPVTEPGIDYCPKLEPVGTQATTLAIGEDIQAALDSAEGGDTIALADGTWNLRSGGLVMNTAGVTLRAAGTGTGGQTGTGTGNAGNCGVPSATGPWGGGFPHPLFGVTVTTDAYTHDGGLDEVVAMAPKSGTVDLSATPITVTGAYIINMGYRADQGDLWLEDANGAIRTWLPFDEGHISTPVAPGDQISFKVTEISEYFGQPQITDFTDFAIESTGNDVRIQDGIGVELDYAATGPVNFEVYGEIVDELGECGGGDNCYNLLHGGVKTEVRLDPKNRTWYTEDCVHIIAPVGISESIVRYDLINWDWWTYIQ